MIHKLCSLLLFLFLLTAWQRPAASYTFTGAVQDNAGNPLIGVSVLVEGTLQGTVTDFDGTFSLQYHASKAKLVFSHLGFETQTLKAKAGVPLTVTLESEKTVLEEVVVTGLAQKQRRAQRIVGYQSPAMMTPGYAPPSYQSGGGMPADDFQHRNTEDYDLINENRFYAATQRPLSTFSIDVDAASYSNMRRFLQNGQQPPKDAVRIEELVNYFRYEYPEPEGEEPFTVNTELSECPWQPRHQLLHIGLQGRRIPTDDLPPSNLVFLLDVSGSMAVPNKLPLLQSSFKLLTEQLRAQDRVAIVVYAGAAGVVLEPTPGDDKQKIRDAIDALYAGGSTAGSAGIQLAYELARKHYVEGGNNRVILATDGDFNVGVSSDAELVRLIEKERESGVFLTVLGFGTGNLKDNKMQQLADKGNGNHAYIDNITEAKKVLVSEFGGTLFAIAKDVKIQIEFNPAKVAGYRLIGYENRVLADEEFNDDQKDAGELGSGHTVTALYEIIPAGVRSEHLAAVDELKYQNTQVDPAAAATGELATVKLRYKAPDSEKSRLVERTVGAAPAKLKKSSDSFRWSAAVAEFGMLLRDSEYKGNATYRHCRELAEGAKGQDEHGYRREFIEMIDTMEQLADPEVARKPGEAKNR